MKEKKDKTKTQTEWSPGKSTDRPGEAIEPGDPDFCVVRNNGILRPSSDT